MMSHRTDGPRGDGPRSRAMTVAAGLFTCVLAGVIGCQSHSAGVSAAVVVEPADPTQDALAAYLADRYRVEYQATRRFVAEAHAAGGEFDVDPLLILAIMAIESSLDPDARNRSGARGLMQVIPKFHRAKLAEHGGEATILEPRVNIMVGTAILKEYVRRTGSVVAGLQRYVGSDDPDKRYARKVLAEKQRLRSIVARSLVSKDA
jgi:hypothetical protein